MMRFGGDDLKESLLQALFTEKTAGVPVTESGQGGFWGHALTENHLQSTLWQHYPGLATAENLQGAQRAAEEALAPFIEQGIVRSVHFESHDSHQGNAPLNLTLILKNRQILKLP